MSKRHKCRRIHGEEEPPRRDFSRRLREVNTLLGEGRREEALRRLNEATRFARGNIDKSRIANLVAKSQFDLGRYEDALERFAEAARLGEEEGLEPQCFLGPSLGKIRCLLKNQQLEEAVRVAGELGLRVRKKAEAYEQLLTAPLQDQENPVSILVPPRPVRPSVALTKMGTAFLEEGHIEQGKVFLEQVIQDVPNGASRARQNLARALLLEGNAERAILLARESILFGSFRVKTIPGWSILIQARKAFGLPLLDADLYQRFRQSGVAGRARARTEVLIITELRRFGDETWLELAHSWRSRSSEHDPIVRVEVLKLLLNEVKSGALQTRESERVALDLLRELVDEPTLSASEGVALAKTLGKYARLNRMSLDEIRDWLSGLRDRFGGTYGLRAAHACAKGMSESGNTVQARKVFLAVQSRAAANSDEWGKAVWSLARLESGEGNHAASADYYLKYAGNAALPTSLRLQAFLRWIQQADASGREINEDEVSRQVLELLGDLEGYRPLLDASRQLALAGDRFRGIYEEVVEIAVRESRKAFQGARTTQEALVVLLALNRRLFYDFHEKEEVVRFFEAIPDKKLGWLWSQDARYWEYLSIVFRSYVDTRRASKGEALAQRILHDPSTPEVGRVLVGIRYGEWLWARGEGVNARALFSRCIEWSPRHRLSSVAYYHLACDAYVKRKRNVAAALLGRGRQALLPRPGVLSEWEIDARSGLLQQTILSDEAQVDLSLYGPDFLAQQGERLSRDLERAGNLK